MRPNPPLEHGTASPGGGRDLSTMRRVKSNNVDGGVLHREMSPAIGAVHVPGPNVPASTFVEESAIQNAGGEPRQDEEDIVDNELSQTALNHATTTAAVVLEATLVEDDNRRLNEAASSSRRLMRAHIEHAVVSRLSQALQHATNIDAQSTISDLSNDSTERDQSDFRFAYGNVSTAGPEGTAYSQSTRPRPRSLLAMQAEKFLRCLHLSDRRYSGMKYKQVFVGCETVDSLLYTKVVSTREEAIELGRTLAKELRLFAHVCGNHDFKDEFLFYRLRNDGLVAPPEKLSPEVKRQLLEKVELFCKVVEVKNRTYRLQKYKRVFVGSEAIDKLVYAGFADTRFDAVQLGRQLAKEFGLFEHVKNEHVFCDEFLFYRYTSPTAVRDSAVSVDTTDKTIFC